MRPQPHPPSELPRPHPRQPPPARTPQLYATRNRNKSHLGQPRNPLLARSQARRKISRRLARESLKVAPNFVEPNPEQLARAEAERQRLRAIFATLTPERLWDGRFHYPLTGVTTGGNFGKRRILNGKPGSPHSGVDFPAPSGTPVYAPQRGRVVLAEPLYFSGNTVILDHGLGLYTLYAHFESISVQPGDLVDTGALLGKVGATGRVTGPHLHWGATVNRARTNPLQLISVLGASAQ